jgi:enolase-like protein
MISICAGQSTIRDDFSAHGFSIMLSNDVSAATLRGRGCRQAAANIGRALHYALAGPVFMDQSELDRAIITLDGTPTKSRIGGNAILTVSVAFARVCQFASVGLAFCCETQPRRVRDLRMKNPATA